MAPTMRARLFVHAMLFLAMATMSSSLPTGASSFKPSLDDESTSPKGRIALRDLDKPASSDFQKPVHISASFAGTALLVFTQHRINERGYLLSRTWWVATDSLMWIWMGFICAAWTFLVFFSAWKLELNDENPCKLDNKSFSCASRLAFTPWILDGVFLWWLVRFIIHRAYRVMLHKRQPIQRGRIYRMLDAWEHWWKMLCKKRFGQKHRVFRDGGLEIVAAMLIWVPIASVVTWTAAGAFVTELYALGILTLTAILMLLHTLSTSESHSDLPHRYAMDDIRIPLPTPIEQGIIYILPSKNYGFDATYSQRLTCEHKLLEANASLFEPLHIIRKDWTLEKCRAAAQQLVESQVRKIEGDSTMIQRLARWLYWHGRGPKETKEACRSVVGEEKFNDWEETDNGFERWMESWERTIPLRNRGCDKRSNYRSIVGRDVALSLLLWEFLVFERRWEFYDEDIMLGRASDSKGTTGSDADSRENVLPHLHDDILPTPNDVWRLRLEKHTGYTFTEKSRHANRDSEGDSSKGDNTAGSAPGIKGFEEAVGEVYRILGNGTNGSGSGVAGYHEPMPLNTLFAETSPSPSPSPTSSSGKSTTERKGTGVSQVTTDKVSDSSHGETRFGITSENAIVRNGIKEVRAIFKNLSPQMLPEPSILDGDKYRTEGSKYVPRDSSTTPPAVQKYVVSKLSDEAVAEAWEKYAGELWNRCWEAYPSTFGALYLWTAVWYIDVGNKGFHTTPLIPVGNRRSSFWIDRGPDYVTVWRIPWRNLWHIAVRCQMVVILPVIIGTAFGLFG